MSFFSGRISFDKRFFTIVFLAGFGPPMFWFISGAFGGDALNEEAWKELGKGTLYSVMYTTVISTAVANIWNVIDKNFSWSEPMKRIPVELFFTSVVAVITMVILTWVEVDVFRACEPGEKNMRYLKNVQITLIMNVIIVFIFEALFFFERWKASEIDNERLEKENINSQFASLKNQVNPHFLFNSLNSLSALIHEDPDRAEEFVDRLAQVYRYVLDVKDKDLIDLQDELKFIRSFLHIQKIRFGDNLRVDINIEDSDLSTQVPPLSLQLMVENCIKHNRITASEPLNISIIAEDNRLHVINNLQPRLGEDVESTGVGIENLKERYKNFTNEQPIFKESAGKYEAVIPLIQSII